MVNTGGSSTSHHRCNNTAASVPASPPSIGYRYDWTYYVAHPDAEEDARADSGSELLWSIPTAKSDRAFNWGESAIAPDAVGKLIAGGLHVPFYFEHELRSRYPKGVIARLSPYTSYYWSPEPGDDQPPFPTTLFVVDTEDVEATYVQTAGRMSLISLPILVSCMDVPDPPSKEKEALRWSRLQSRL